MDVGLRVTRDGDFYIDGVYIGADASFRRWLADRIGSALNINIADDDLVFTPGAPPDGGSIKFELHGETIIEFRSNGAHVKDIPVGPDVAYYILREEWFLPQVGEASVQVELGAGAEVRRT